MSEYVRCDEYLGTCDKCQHPVRLTNILVYPYLMVGEAVICFLHPDDFYRCAKCGGMVNRINVYGTHKDNSIIKKEVSICQN